LVRTLFFIPRCTSVPAEWRRRSGSCFDLFLLLFSVPDELYFCVPTLWPLSAFLLLSGTGSGSLYLLALHAHSTTLYSDGLRVPAPDRGEDRSRLRPRFSSSFFYVASFGVFVDEAGDLSFFKPVTVFPCLSTPRDLFTPSDAVIGFSLLRFLFFFVGVLLFSPLFLSVFLRGWLGGSFFSLFHYTPRRAAVGFVLRRSGSFSAGLLSFLRSLSAAGWPTQTGKVSLTSPASV